MFLTRRGLIMIAAVTVAVLATACGGGGPEPSSGGSSSSATRPSGRGVCGLLMQGEVDALFGKSTGAGDDEALDDSSELCSWPSGDTPQLMLQVGPSAGGAVREAVDLGAGYRVVDVEGLDGSSAMAIQEADEAVAIVALETGEKTIVISPIGLGIREGTPEFDELKNTLSAAASRLGLNARASSR